MYNETNPMNKSSKPRHDHRVLAVLLLVFLVSASITGYLVFTTVKDTFGDWRSTLLSLKLSDGRETPVPFLENIPDINAPLQERKQPPPQAWDG